MMTKLLPEERIKDLRVERRLTGKDLCELIGVPESTYNGYERGNEIPHSVVLKLAEFYGVTTDYLLGVSENRNPANADLTDLHLQDKTIELLKSEKLNNRLICEMIEHEEFPKFLVDAEIYIDRWMENYIRILDFVLLQFREQFTENCGTVIDPAVIDEQLQNFRGSDDDYFAQNVADHIFKIVYDIKEAHRKDITTSPHTSVGDLLCNVGAVVQTMMEPTAESIYEAVCGQYGIDDKRMSGEQIEAVKEFFGKASVVKAGKKGRVANTVYTAPSARRYSPSVPLI